MGIILDSVLVVKWDEIDCLWVEHKLSGASCFSPRNFAYQAQNIRNGFINIFQVN
jgi:hypothetical protein